MHSMRHVDYVHQVVGVVSLWPDRSAGRVLYAWLVVLRERVVNRTEIARGGTPCGASGCAPSNDFEKCARLASYSARGVIELMPISDGRLYSFKYVNGHPRNTSAGLLTVTAFGVLAEVETGYPLLLSELTVTTALRTAAMSALAASGNRSCRDPSASRATRGLPSPVLWYASR
jgi:hypothetical protein